MNRANTVFFLEGDSIFRQRGMCGDSLEHPKRIYDKGKRLILTLTYERDFAYITTCSERFFKLA